jgi:CheY-like chemotaxis protein
MTSGMSGLFTALSVGLAPWAGFVIVGVILVAVGYWLRRRRDTDEPRTALILDEVAQARAIRLAKQPLTVRTEPAAAKRLAGLRILAVDDDGDWRELLTRILAGAGAEARVVPSAAEALRLLEDWRPDVVLTDLAMPGTDGYALAAAVAARQDRRRPIPTVAMSAHGSAHERIRTARAGFVAHLTKPVLADDLIRTLGRAADPAPRARTERRVV